MKISKLLADAKKCEISMKGYALFQWDFSSGFARNSVQMPEDVIDLILSWRDKEKKE